MVEEASIALRLKKWWNKKLSFKWKKKHNYLMSEKYKKTCKYLNYVENLLIIASTVNYWVSISALASLVCVPVGIKSSAAGIKICAIIAVIKKSKSIIKEKNKKHNKVVGNDKLGKDKLNTFEVLISKVLIDSYITHDEFVSVNNVLRE